VRWSLGLVLACTRPAPEPVHDTAKPAAAFELVYATYGLMPAPKCGSPTYEIRIAGDRHVTCGWRSACPPYSEAAPLAPIAKGQLTASDVDELATIATSRDFTALPEFASNPHIIDGGVERIEVTVGEHKKVVELANLDKPAFTALRDALQARTSCSLATAGPEPR